MTLAEMLMSSYRESETKVQAKIHGYITPCNNVTARLIYKTIILE